MIKKAWELVKTGNRMAISLILSILICLIVLGLLGNMMYEIAKEFPSALYIFISFFVCYIALNMIIIQKKER